jgi:putative transposase
MPYRTITFDWLPRSGVAWRTFTAARQEAANVWGWLVEAHADIRAMGADWPGKAEWQKLAKGRFPNLHSQSVQQTVADFCEAITATVALRQNGHAQARYPFYKAKYRCVIFTNQAAKIKGGVLTLPCGQAGKLYVRIPQEVVLPGRLMEVRLHFGTVELVCEIPAVACTAGPTIGIDLGVNTLLAATDGEKALLVSGRAVKSVVRLRNKRLGEISSKQAGKVKGSRSWRRLQRLKHRTLNKTHRQVRDLCHKATRKVADAFPNAKAYVGEPFNDAAQKMRRVQAQQVSQACNAVLIAMLAYKLASAIRVNEAYTSQTDPVCGARNRCGRIYRCACGTVAPRDVIGCTNIRSIGLSGSLQTGCRVPNAIHWVHPNKYAGAKPASRTDTAEIARGQPREATGL